MPGSRSEWSGGGASLAFFRAITAQYSAWICAWSTLQSLQYISVHSSRSASLFLPKYCSGVPLRMPAPISFSRLRISSCCTGSRPSGASLRRRETK
eukprot:6486637-Pyramimonas_sp.AAC.1